MVLVVGEQGLDLLVDEQLQIIRVDPVEDQEGGQGVVVGEGVGPLQPRAQLQGALGLLIIGHQLVHPHNAAADAGLQVGLLHELAQLGACSAQFSMGVRCHRDRSGRSCRGKTRQVFWERMSSMMERMVNSPVFSIHAVLEADAEQIGVGGEFAVQQLQPVGHLLLGIFPCR